MFTPDVYIQRRNTLRQRLRQGVALMIGHNEAPINFAHNTYPFRQDATFSYFFGICQPGLVGLIELDNDLETLFLEESTDPDAIIWQPQRASPAQMATASGCDTVKERHLLQAAINKVLRSGRSLHFLPPYRSDTAFTLSQLIQWLPKDLGRLASSSLTREVVAMREVKEPRELAQIESALRVTDEMHRLAMRMTRAGMIEREIVAHMRQVLGREGLQEAYSPIFTRHGEILHNLEHENHLLKGDLVINDAGACSPLGYASDVTRTLPVGGRFEPQQRELYELLLDVQEHAIQQARSHVRFLDVHLAAAHRLADGMKALGFFTGNTADIVESGAYALCFPHGLGHLLGLDVHDMESLGEDWVGYDHSVSRSEQFGLGNLRLGKPLKRGMVLTVEPGVYFIPALIKRWQAERRHTGLINYERFIAYENFGAMRIEDIVLVEDSRGQVLGPAIPKHPDDVENCMA